MKDFFHVMSDGPALCNNGNGCGSGFNSEPPQNCAMKGVYRFWEMPKQRLKGQEMAHLEMSQQVNAPQTDHAIS